MDDDLTDEQRRIKAAYTEHRYWTGNFADILKLEPSWLEAYGALTAHAWERSGLSPKEREFIHVAIDASTTHLYNMGTRAHIKKALDAGASVDELTSVLLIASDAGFNGAREGFRVLADELDGQQIDDDADEESLAEQFRESRGFLDADVRSILETDAAFFEHYLDISSIPARTGALDPVMRSLIAVAVDAAGTTLYTRGVRTHVRTALERGATPEHVAGVIEIASILGSHTLIESAGMLREEAERRGVLPDDR